MFVRAGVKCDVFCVCRGERLGSLSRLLSSELVGGVVTRLWVLETLGLTAISLSAINGTTSVVLWVLFGSAPFVDLYLKIAALDLDYGLPVYGLALCESVIALGDFRLSFLSFWCILRAGCSWSAGVFLGGLAE